jgi:hypothetical protein
MVSLLYRMIEASFTYSPGKLVRYVILLKLNLQAFFRTPQRGDAGDAR